MMNFKEIQELLKQINKSSITEFKISEGDFKLSISANQQGEPQIQHYVSAPAPQPQAQVVVSAPAPQAAPVAQTATPVASAEPAAPAPNENAGLIAIKSPIVGTFYRSAGPEKPPYLKVGDSVNVGQVVCIVEAMKLFNEIESEIKGKVVKVVAEDASPVEYDQVLFLIDPKG